MNTKLSMMILALTISVQPTLGGDVTEKCVVTFKGSCQHSGYLPVFKDTEAIDIYLETKPLLPPVHDTACLATEGLDLTISTGSANRGKIVWVDSFDARCRGFTFRNCLDCRSVQ